MRGNRLVFKFRVNLKAHVAGCELDPGNAELQSESHHIEFLLRGYFILQIKRAERCVPILADFHIGTGEGPC